MEEKTEEKQLAVQKYISVVLTILTVFMFIIAASVLVLVAKIGPVVRDARTCINNVNEKVEAIDVDNINTTFEKLSSSVDDMQDTINETSNMMAQIEGVADDVKALKEKIGALKFW